MPSVTAPMLRGIIVRDDDDKVIVQATRQDVQRFAPRPGQEVNVRPATVRMRARPRNLYSYGPGWPPFSGSYAGSNFNMASTYMDNAVSSGDDRHSEMEPGDIDLGDYLFDRYGRAVATVSEVNYNVERIDMTSLGEVVRNFGTGAVTIDIRANGLPGVSVNGQRVGG